MDKKMKKSIMFLIAFGILLFAVCTNLTTVLGFLNNVVSLILPVIVGLLLAFIINVPMSGIEKLIFWLFRKSKKQPKVKLVQVASLILTFVCIALVLALAATLAVPEFIESGKSIYSLIQTKLPELLSWLDRQGIGTQKLREWIASVDFSNMFGTLTDSAGVVVRYVVDIATATLSGVVSVLFAIVIALYVLLSKDTVGRQSRKILYAFVKKELADKICYVSTLTAKTYSKFFSGQCIEALILGTLIFIAFSIFRMPYAGVIAILTGISAFIPYVGAFGACFLGAFLILLVNPVQALVSIIIYSVVQFVETQFIYPHVVGGSVGLSPLLTLIAALIGGKLFGILGIVFFIPLTAVAYTLIRDYINKRLDKKEIKVK